MKFIISTANIGFFFTRFMLFIGKFNYGKRGILDLTHTRLFTFKTLKAMLEQSGFEVLDSVGVPAPFPLAVGNTALARMLLSINRALIALNKSLFSYQMMMVAKPRCPVSSGYLASRKASFARNPPRGRRTSSSPLPQDEAPPGELNL